jgi:CBS domain-containing protein
MAGPALNQQKKPSVLAGFLVKEVMRRKVVRLPPESTVESALRSMIKHRVSGLLIEHAANARPAGVLSKTDIMGAYYADLPIGIKIGDIMSRPVLSCQLDDSLEEALQRMKEHRVTRLYVNAEDDGAVIGVLAYPEVVGLMYRHCHYCRKSLFKGQYISSNTKKAILRLTVGDIMGTEVLRLPGTATIMQVIEELSSAVGSEVLICNDDGAAVGVVTISDVVMAYRHGRKQDELARQIMTTPVRLCNAGAMLEEAIQTMIFADVGRLFVRDEKNSAIMGVLNLADTAKARSGSCQACIVSRITIKD